jgi:hypothetical protein
MKMLSHSGLPFCDRFPYYMVKILMDLLPNWNPVSANWIANYAGATGSHSEQAHGAHYESRHAELKAVVPQEMVARAHAPGGSESARMVVQNAGSQTGE